jgi:hypothetical protein
LRFTCLAARLRAVDAAIPLICTVFSSLTPCSGMQSVPVPPLAAFPQYVLDPATSLLVTRVLPIPKGATEARVNQASAFSYVLLYQHSGDLLFSGPASDWADWRSLPAASFYVDVQERADPITSVLTPVAAEMQFR